MRIEKFLFRLPLIGGIIKPLYNYFTHHIFFADAIHVLLGLGVAFLLVGESWMNWGWICLGASVLGHVYAFIKGR